MPPEQVLHLIDVVANKRERLLSIRQGQQVVQKLGPVGRPGQMFRKARRRDPITEAFQARQVIGIERTFAPDRQADTVNRDGELIGQRVKLRQGASPVTHVVLGVNLDPSHRTGVIAQRVEVLRLVADAGGGGQGIREVTHGEVVRTGGAAPAALRTPGQSAYAGRSRSSGSNDPLRADPSAIWGRSISSQVPASTSVQAFPW